MEYPEEVKSETGSELINVEQPVNEMMQRMAKLRPSLYWPQYRSDTIDYVNYRSAVVRRMVHDTDRVKRTMKKAKDDLEALDREVAHLQETQWRTLARKKYFVPEKPSDFVFYKYDKYSLLDFLPKHHFFKEYK